MTLSFALESVLVAVVIVSLSDDFAMLGCPIRRSNNRTSYGSLPIAFKSPRICQDYLSYCLYLTRCCILSYEQRMLSELKDIRLRYGATELSKSASNTLQIRTLRLDHDVSRGLP